MKVNKTTLLFEDLTESQKEDLKSLAKQIVLHGKIPDRHNPYLEMWLGAANLPDYTYLINVSMVFPTRALLSIL